MAIITDIIDERGYTYRQQYCRVDGLFINKARMSINMGVYESAEQAATEGAAPHRLETLPGPFDLYGDLNPWQQAYAIIKERWPNAVDA